MEDIIVPGIFLIIMSVMSYKFLKKRHMGVGLLSLAASILLVGIIVLMIWINFIK